MCGLQKPCQGASLRSKQLTFVAAIALNFDMGICFRRRGRLPVRCAQQFTLTRSTTLQQYRHKLDREFHLIKLFRHADSYSYLLLTYSKRLIRNKFPGVVFPQAAQATELPDYRIIFVICVNLTRNTVLRLKSTGLEL